MLLNIEHLKKTYQTHNTKTHALRDVSFGVDQNEYIAIMGESGSGKSTLLNLIATFDKPTAGTIQLDGQDISTIKSKDLAEFRRQQLGFVFQSFNVLETFNNKDNILLPLVLSGTKPKAMAERLAECIKPLGIDGILEKYPYEISGGQRQRVAIARAIINQPSLLLADEPTGALDSTSSKQILSLFKRLHEQGNTILMVTHSIQAAATADRILFLTDGRIFHELYRGELSDIDFQEKIADSLTLLNHQGV